MLKHVDFFKGLLTVLAVCCFCGSAVLALDVNAFLKKADNMLAAGKCVEALEMYSKCAGAAPDNAAASEGMRHAKSAIRQQMGDVSAARLTKMLDKLDAIDADRVANLTQEVVVLEKEKAARAAQIVTLEGELDTSRSKVTSTESELARIQKKLADAKTSEAAARKTIAKLNRDLVQIKKDRLADQQTARNRLEKWASENKGTENAGDRKETTAALKRAQSHNQSLDAKLDNVSSENMDLKSQILAMRSKNNVLTDEKTRLLNQLKTSAVPGSELADLKTQNASLRAEKEHLLKNANNSGALSQELSALKLKNTALIKENKTLSIKLGNAIARAPASPVASGVPGSKASREASEALKELKTGLQDLESNMPQPVKIQAPPATPVAQTRAFKRSFKKLTRQSEKFSADVSEVTVLAGDLEQEISQTSDTIDKRLNAMDETQSRAEINLKALNQRLQETETLTTRGSE